MTAPAARHADLLPRRRPRNTFWLSSMGFVAPAVMLAAVVLYLPFIYTSYISFTEYNGLGDPSWIGHRRTTSTCSPTPVW